MNPFQGPAVTRLERIRETIEVLPLDGGFVIRWQEVYGRPRKTSTIPEFQAFIDKELDPEAKKILQTSYDLAKKWLADPVRREELERQGAFAKRREGWYTAHFAYEAELERFFKGGKTEMKNFLVDVFRAGFDEACGLYELNGTPQRLRRILNLPGRPHEIEEDGSPVEADPFAFNDGPPIAGPTCGAAQQYERSKDYEREN